MGFDDREHTLSRIEWNAWQAVVKEWNNAIRESMNEEKYNPLIKAIQDWGEEFAMLRIYQNERKGA